MSIDALRENTRKRLAEKIDASIQIMMGQQFRPAIIDGAGTALPANTLEEIAVKTLECNAFVRAYQFALSVLDEEYKKIVDPAGAPASETAQDKEGFY